MASRRPVLFSAIIISRRSESKKGGSESDDHDIGTAPLETTITHDEFLQHMSACREYICAKHSRRAVFKLMAVDRMCREERSESVVRRQVSIAQYQWK